jgi:MFS family permease
VWPVYVAVGTFGATRAFWAPAGQAILPSLVPRQQFPDAVAINAILFQVAVIAGPALGGVLFLLGAAVVYGVCLALFLVALVVMAGARTPPIERGAETALDQQFLEGVRFVLRERAVLGVISLDLFAVLFGGATALLPIFANDLLHVGPAGLGLLRTAPGAGAALTAGLLALRPIRRHAGAWMFGGVAVFGLATIAFGLSRLFPLSLLALGIAGAGDMLSVYIRGILVQLRTPDAIRGRVSAVNSMFIGASNELGEFESGVTASWFGTVPAVLIGGLCTLVVAAVWLRRFPELRRLDHMH